MAKFMNKFATFSLALGLISSSIFAASFDCTKASMPVDKMICQDPNLNMKDSYMGLLYLSLVQDSSKITRDVMRSQKQWLDARNQCTDSVCISKAYEQRITELKKYQPTVSDINNHLDKGKWITNYSNQFAAATLEIKKMDKDGFDYQITANNGANSGQIEARALFIDGDALTIDKSLLTNQSATPCIMLFQYSNKSLVVTDNDACSSYAGNGVSFEGSYEKGRTIRVLDLDDQGLLDNKQQELEFKAMTGKNYDLFVNGCGGSTSTENEASQAPKAIVRTAFMRGLANSTACIVMSDNNKLWAAVLDNEQIKYFTNDPSYRTTLPLSINTWIKDIESSQGKSLKVIYASVTSE